MLRRFCTENVTRFDEAANRIILRVECHGCVSQNVEAV